MIDISEAKISKLIFHRFSQEEDLCFLNDDEHDIRHDDEHRVLKKILLKPFMASGTTWEFSHDVDVALNPLRKLAFEINDGKDFVQRSQKILMHLRAVSKHPNIKDGDLFVVKFDELRLNGKYYNGVGIYKVESRESFIETTGTRSQFGLKVKQGIGSRKLDKACLILFTEDPTTVFVIDNNSRETDYWQNEFIKVQLRGDHVNSTNQFLSLAKTFVTEQLPASFEVTKADQIDMLNRSVNYFKTHESFDKEEFEQEVLQDNAVISSFQNFNTSYREQNAIELDDNFEISAQAVKKQARVFRNVLKLDRNFDIYIHGDKSLIEQGMEADGRKFYKIYYEVEN